jgi:pyruvate kinase
VALSTASVTAKDRQDLEWALKNELDFIGLSFVRQAEDIVELKRLIESRRPKLLR